jgi:hypothetical protein
VARWADEKVAKTWGPHATARLCHIARTGWDGRIKNPFEKAQPHALRVVPEHKVPGAFAPVGNVFHVSQALSWLASHRDAIEGQFERISAVEGLTLSLMDVVHN